MKISLKGSIFLMLLVFSQTNYLKSQIANGYPGDDSIQTNPNVIFAEMFEEATITQMLSYWTSKSWIPSNIAFGSTVPAGSHGNKSLKLTTIIGSDSTEDTFIFKRFATGINDSVFVRYYIKYNNSSTFHHSGVWMGGNYPPVNNPRFRAGYKPAGDSAFHIGSEVRGATRYHQNSAYFGYYNYWMSMHQSNDTNPATGSGYYWGNGLINNNPLANIDMNGWVCIEVMIKLNNPVTGNTGELALWINGVKVSHFGYNFPNGTWNWSDFTQGAGVPFEGFQFRNNSVLKFNYIWLKNYSTYDSIGHINDMYIDHVVVAKSYIGPIYTNPIGIINSTQSTSGNILIFPDMVSGNIKIEPGNELIKSIKIYNVLGKLMGEYFTNDISFSNFPKGIYFVSVLTNKTSLTRKILRM